MSPGRVAANMTQLALSVVGLLLSLRFVLRLLNADVTNRVVQWVYDTTQPVVHPFFNWFPPVRTGDGFVVELPTLLALVSYSVLAFLALAAVGAWQNKANPVVAGNKRRFRISFIR